MLRFWLSPRRVFQMMSADRLMCFAMRSLCDRSSGMDIWSHPNPDGS
ncbi:hypothetical protein DAI22_04g075600 [Oryza sativa Japonica Group]|nr:hypothetical protein DAI22_04g075600 [Oryza sativa Japonica Group]